MSEGRGPNFHSATCGRNAKTVTKKNTHQSYRQTQKVKVASCHVGLFDSEESCLVLLWLFWYSGFVVVVMGSHKVEIGEDDPEGYTSAHLYDY